MTSAPASSDKEFEKLIGQYDELRDAELELLKSRLIADRDLQKVRFKIARLTAEITRLSSMGDMPCW